MEEEHAQPSSLGSLLSSYTVPVADARTTERGTLLRYFSEKLQRPIPRVCAYLKGMQDLSTLYYIKSSCDQAEARGVAWGAAFHTSIKVK